MATKLTLRKYAPRVLVTSLLSHDSDLFFDYLGSFNPRLVFTQPAKISSFSPTDCLPMQATFKIDPCRLFTVKTQITPSFLTSPKIADWLKL